MRARAGETQSRRAALSEYQKTEKQGRIVGKSNLLDFSTNADGGEISPYSDLYFLLSNNQIELLFLGLTKIAKVI